MGIFNSVPEKVYDEILVACESLLGRRSFGQYRVHFRFLTFSQIDRDYQNLT